MTVATDRPKGRSGTTGSSGTSGSYDGETADLRAEVTRGAAQLDVSVMALTAANRELEAFCYSVSHDLRTPLRSIDGFSQALLEDYADRLDDTGRDYLRRVRAAAQRMGDLIDDMLRLSRLTRDQMIRETVDLSSMAREIIAELQATDSVRRVDVVIPDGIRVVADPVLIRAVLENLLSNSWKFTSHHPTARIELGTSDRGGEAAYYVRDDGAGFSMDYADKLFGAFQRLHAMDEFPGNGIGLASVQRVVNRHGGRVWAEGAVEGGATFYFTVGAPS